MKKGLRFTLALFLLLTTLSLCVYAANIAEGKAEDVSWSISDSGTLTVSGEGAIPNYTRSVVAPWNSYAKQIRKIVVADGITSVGDYAFYNLSKATSIELASSVKSLGTQFIRGTAITSVTLPAVERLEEQAFARADSLTTIIAGESVKDIYGTVFFSETVTIKAPSDSYIAKYAENFADFFTVNATVSFESTGNAKAPINYYGKAGENCFYAVYQKSSTNWSYEISGSGKMKNFPYVSDKGIALGYTFTPTYYMGGNERNIQSVVVYDGVTTLGNYLFYKCTKVSSIDVQGAITSIGRGVFQACARLKSFTVPESVTKIERNAFNGCKALTEVYIPAGVTVFEEGVFVKCDTSAITVYTDSKTVVDVLAVEYPEITVKPATPGCEHSITEFEKKDATCTTDGYEAYFECTLCGELFSDAEGNIPLDKIVVIPATGHTYSAEWSSDASYHWHASICGHDVVADKMAHTIENGTCSVCTYKETPIYTAPTFVIDDVSVGSAGEVEVTLSVVNNPGILGMTLSIGYDDTAMTLVGAAGGDAVDMLSLVKPKNFKNGCNFVWYGEALDTADIKDGAVLTLTFSVPDSANGTYPITVSYEEGSIFDADLSPVEIDIKNGSITANGSGTTTPPEEDDEEPEVFTEPTFVLNNVTSSGSTQVEVALSIANNPGILGMTLSIGYDDTAMTLVGAVGGDAVDMLSLVKPKNFKNGCNFVWYGEALDTADVKDGTILKLVFDVTNAADGTYPVTVSYDEGSIFDANLSPVDINIKNGSIKIDN